VLRDYQNNQENICHSTNNSGILLAPQNTATSEEILRVLRVDTTEETMLTLVSQ